MATTSNLSFDRYIARSQSRSRSSSANSSTLSQSLPPPPRVKKPSSPDPLAPSSTFQASRNLKSSSPARQPNISMASTVSPPPDRDQPRRPNPFADFGSGHRTSSYSESISSLNSYSNIFYKPPGDNATRPETASTRSQSQSNIRITDFDSQTSVEDYSDLLYPELGPPSMQPDPSMLSAEVHGPPIRKRASSLLSHDGPESPVEFASHGILASSQAILPEDRSSSNIDQLLSFNGTANPGRGSTERLLPMEIVRRDSFMEFDPAPQHRSKLAPSSLAEMVLKAKPSISDEMPFPSSRINIRLGKPPGDYQQLLDSVDPQTGETIPTNESRQILVDGSDKAVERPNTASSIGSWTGSIQANRPSTTNLLDHKERQDLLRKTRKIVQVLGNGAVPVAQASLPYPTDQPSPRRDAIHRAVRSDSLPLDDPKQELARQITPTEQQLHPKSSWSVLNHDTVFLDGSGRRHSSPLNANFKLDSDVASLSSLGSIIGSRKSRDSFDDKKSRKSARSGSPRSFIEMSDEEGAKTPKRRASPDRSSSTAQLTESERSGNSLNSKVDTILVTPDHRKPQRRLGSPDTQGTKASSSLASRQEQKPKIRASSILSLSDEEGDRLDGGWRHGATSHDRQRERQRKREKLAKIHRFLGSKVPAELVFGYSSSTPYVQITREVTIEREPSRIFPSDGTTAEVKRRRRSSSAAMYPSRDLETKKRYDPEMRTRDKMTEVERMIQIKRAQKIEQIFGEQPPRRMSSPTVPTKASLMHRDSISPPRAFNQASPPLDQPAFSPPKEFKQRPKFGWKDGRPSTSGSSRPSTAQSTSGLLASYNKDVERERKAQLKERKKPFHESIDISASRFPVGTALGSPWEDLYCADVIDISPNVIQDSKSPVMPGVPTSRQFLDYRNSLISLGRILDQDDRQSLNELHAVLDSDGDEEDTFNEMDDRLLQASRVPSKTQSGSITERTLQPRASITSISTVNSVSTFATLTPEPMAFQARRKRAAKLTHFFGASYRDLFGEVLDRIERGMLEEARAGEISQLEMKQLMKHMNKLKTRQSMLA